MKKYTVEYISLCNNEELEEIQIDLFELYMTDQITTLELEPLQKAVTKTKLLNDYSYERLV